jgi:hypothetical protein
MRSRSTDYLNTASTKITFSKINDETRPAVENATETLAGVCVMARGADGKKQAMKSLTAASRIPAARLRIRARKNSLINFRILHPLRVNGFYHV